MSTTFTLKCTAGTGKQTEIHVIDSLNPLPFSDTWEAVTVSDWSEPGGNALNLGQHETRLSCVHGGFHILYDFSKELEVGAKGDGSKA